MGVWSDATDGWDDRIDTVISRVGEGFSGIYHMNEPGVWEGPTGFYRTDHRKPMESDSSKTWDSLYVWAGSSYAEDSMYLSIIDDLVHPPPAERNYSLKLLQVPDGMEGAPPVGTVWNIPLGPGSTLELPTYRTTNGLESYRFAFTMSEVPEPATMSLVALGAGAMLCWRRRPEEV